MLLYAAFAYFAIGLYVAISMFFDMRRLCGDRVYRDRLLAEVRERNPIAAEDLQTYLDKGSRIFIAMSVFVAFIGWPFFVKVGSG